MKKYKIILVAVLVGMSFCSHSRTFDFKFLGTQGASDGKNTNWYTTKTKRAFYQIKVGSALKTDSKDEIEVRAATIMKNIKDKKVDVNDIATFKFMPINVGKAIYLEVATGTSFCRVDNDRFYYSDYSHGWQMAGCYIEIRQKGKIIKKYAGAKGLPKNLVLDDKVKQMRLDDKGDEVSEYREFSNATEIYATTSDRKRVDIEEVLAQFAQPGDGDEPDKTDKGKATADDDDGDGKDEFLSEDDFDLKKFCGYEFGSDKPELMPKGVVRMARPFRHYEYVRPTYGTYSGKLTEVMLECRRPMQDQEERDRALAGVVALFEKKYGVRFRNSGDSYYFNNDHVNIWISFHRIEVRNLDWTKRERRKAESEREQSRSSMKGADADKDADVL